MRPSLALMVLLGLVLGAAAAKEASGQEDLVTDISRHLISIQSNFTGAELLLFGTVGDNPGGQQDVVVVVRGPDIPVVVRKKERIAGIWVNYGTAELANVPGYYAVASTRPLYSIALPSVLERYGIGTQYLGFQPVEGTEPNPGPLRPYAEAAVRIRTGEALYREQPDGVLFLGRSLFRATFEMPANVPDGLYTARVYLFRDGSVVQAQTSTLFVSKAGFERLVYDFAYGDPLIYGIVAVLIAGLAGWGASAVFRGV